MATSTEKLHATRDHLEPQLEALLANDRGMAASVAVAFMRPQIEAKVDELLARSPDDLDAILFQIIDVTAGHLSDTVRAFAVGPGGIDGGALVDGYVGHRDQVELRAPGPGGGGDQVG